MSKIWRWNLSDWFLFAGLSVEKNHLIGEEGSSITVECTYSEKYRYSIATYLSSNVAESSFAVHTTWETGCFVPGSFSLHRDGQSSLTDSPCDFPSTDRAWRSGAGTETGAPVGWRTPRGALKTLHWQSAMTETGLSPWPWRSCSSATLPGTCAPWDTTR